MKRHPQEELLLVHPVLGILPLLTVREVVINHHYNNKRQQPRQEKKMIVIYRVLPIRHIIPQGRLPLLLQQRRLSQHPLWPFDGFKYHWHDYVEFYNEKNDGVDTYRGNPNPFFKSGPLSYHPKTTITQVAILIVMILSNIFLSINGATQPWQHRQQQ